MSRHRFTITIDNDLHDQICLIANKNRHSKNTTVELLLIQAVKERNRKKKKND